MLAQAMSEKVKRGSPIARALLVLGCALLVPIVPFVLIGELPGERWLDAGGHDALAVAGLGAGLLALDVLMPIPSSVLGALLGGRLGLALGFAATFAGLCAGSALGYGLGRLLPARFGASEAASAAPSLALVFVSRPAPVFAEAVSIAAGATRAPLRGFAISSALGNAIYASALAADGALLLPQGLAGPGLVLPMLVPVLAFLAFKRWKKS